MEDHEEAEKSALIRYCITGFGEFAGVSCNPSEALVNELKNTSDSSYLIDRCDILEVSTIESQSYVENVFQSCHANSICVHIGVDYKGTEIKLETAAWNNMTFRVPDQKGFQPTNECIDCELSFDSPLQSSLPIDDIVATLKQEGFQVTSSCDPGRFICNYIYYKSLNSWSSGNKPLNSIFIHIPPFSVLGMDEQMVCTRRILSLIAASKL